MTGPVSSAGGDVAINNPPQVVPTESPKPPPKGSDLFGGAPVVIVASEAYDDGHHYLIGGLDYAKRFERHFAKEAKPANDNVSQGRLQGRVKMILSELSQSRSSVFMEKIQSLASAIKKLFTRTHPDFKPLAEGSTGKPMATVSVKELLPHASSELQPLQPLAEVASEKSYKPVMSAVYDDYERNVPKQGSMPQKIVLEEGNSRGVDPRQLAYLALDKMDNLRQEVKQVPELSGKIWMASRDGLSEMLRLEQQFGEIVSHASKLPPLAKNDKGYGDIFYALSHKKGIPYIQKQSLRNYILRTIDTIDKVLDQKYSSGNPELDKAFRDYPPSFRDFGKKLQNPFETLKSNTNFGENEEKQLRAWLDQGLQVIAKASQMIDAAMLSQDSNRSIAGEYDKFVSISNGKASV